ncbi:MAG TPA: hypothetical protein ENN45_04990 [Bacteroidetes bacterium]|nr:hypothetical protein [Bacteroidota bacterium]
MNDIETENSYSPDIIYVVSCSEASHLATPQIINESIKITLKTLDVYRNFKKNENFQGFFDNAELNSRTNQLYSDALTIINAIEKNIKNPYTPEGLYKIFAAGFLVAPYLWEGKDEFRNSIKW